MFGTDGDGAKTLFYQGKAAMMVQGGWFIVEFINAMEELAENGSISVGDEGDAVADAVNFELGSFNMPSMEGEGIEAKARTIEVATGFIGAVSKNQEHDDLVVDFLMFYSSAEGMTAYMDAALAAGYAPSGPSLVYGVEYPENVANAFANLTMIGNAQKGKGQMLARGLGDIADSTRVYYDNAYSFLTGSITVDEYVQKQEQNMLDHLDECLANNGISRSDLEHPELEPTGED